MTNITPPQTMITLILFLKVLFIKMHRVQNRDDFFLNREKWLPAMGGASFTTTAVTSQLLHRCNRKRAVLGFFPIGRFIYE